MSLISRDSRTGKVKVHNRCPGSNCSFRAAIFSCALFLSSFRRMPTSFFWPAGTLRKSATSSLMAPFLLRYLIRSASSSSALAAFSASTSLQKLVDSGYHIVVIIYSFSIHKNDAKIQFYHCFAFNRCILFFINSDCQAGMLFRLCVRLSI